MNSATIEAVRTYAKNAPAGGYYAPPDEQVMNRGVVPLDTLPAAWWNWMWDKITTANILNVDALNDLRVELANVVSLKKHASAADPSILEPDVPDETITTQLKDAIEYVIRVEHDHNDAALTLAVTNLEDAINTLRQDMIDTDTAIQTDLATLQQTHATDVQTLNDLITALDAAWKAALALHESALATEATPGHIKVHDDLETLEGADALSAKQGALLKQRCDELEFAIDEAAGGGFTGSTLLYFDDDKTAVVCKSAKCYFWDTAAMFNYRTAFQVSGIVRDSQTKTGLKGVHVRLLYTEPVIETDTKDDGSYMLRAVPPAGKLKFTHPDYFDLVQPVLNAATVSPYMIGKMKTVVVNLLDVAGKPCVGIQIYKITGITDDYATASSIEAIGDVTGIDGATTFTCEAPAQLGIRGPLSPVPETLSRTARTIFGSDVYVQLSVRQTTNPDQEQYRVSTEAPWLYQAGYWVLASVPADQDGPLTVRPPLLASTMGVTRIEAEDDYGDTWFQQRLLDSDGHCFPAIESTDRVHAWEAHNAPAGAFNIPWRKLGETDWSGTLGTVVEPGGDVIRLIGHHLDQPDSYTASGVYFRSETAAASGSYIFKITCPITYNEDSIIISMPQRGLGPGTDSLFARGTSIVGHLVLVRNFWSDIFVPSPNYTFKTVEEVLADAGARTLAWNVCFSWSLNYDAIIQPLPGRLTIQW